MIIDHLSVGVSDLEKAEGFYDEVLGALEINQLAKMKELLGYGKEFIQFVAMYPSNGESVSAGNGVHIAFSAGTKEQVDKFYQLALEFGGCCGGKPGPRSYPHKEVYAAFVYDPFGNKLEALTDGFSRKLS